MPLSSQQSPLRVRVLRSGSAGNAIIVEAGDLRFLIDAGLPAETILRELDGSGPPRLDAILLTHEHDDHMKGAPAVARATGAVILANGGTIRAASGALVGARIELFRTGQPFCIGQVEVTPFLLPHDAAEPVGFLLSGHGVRIAVACDLGDISDALLDVARGVDALLVEANYDVRLLAVSTYPWFLKNRIVSAWGHLSNDGAARAAVAIASDRLRAIQLVHLSDVNNLAPLARDVVREALEAEGLRGVHVAAVRPNAGGPWWEAPLAAGATR
jgi:phosphoribosyl 1,2-cyclic phosphodiesterase